ncbi:MAG: hypothetical protein F7B59_01900 [Desulfurococcales archaeon]|nr:hypothetical protein [Desulfurococcales archaeon]
MTAEDKWVSNSGIDYVSALILILITGLLVISIALPGISGNLLFLALFLSTSVLYLQWRTPNALGIKVISIILIDILYFINFFIARTNVATWAIFSLLVITASISLVRKDPIAVVPILSLAIESMLHPLQNIHYLIIVLLLSTLPLFSSRRIHSLLPLIAVSPLLLFSPNSLVSTLITLTYILFISNSIENLDKCPFRREISLVIGGFFIQVITVLVMLFSHESSTSLLSYWILGYMISAIGLTSPPFYKPAPDNRVVYRKDA